MTEHPQGTDRQLLQQAGLSRPKPMSKQPTFNCTACGQCCHNLKLPLGMDEAVDWLRRGGRVQVICEAIPWVAEPDAADAVAAHKRSISFAAMSGQLPIRVLVYLVASFDGPCPQLGAHNMCGIYAHRPLTCRIYPAEVNPFVATNPTLKACPPDAWQGAVPLMTDTLHADVQAFRWRAQAEVARKAWVCAQLGIQSSAISNQGYAIHSPDPGHLLRALLDCPVTAAPQAHGDWALTTHLAEHLQTLQDMGAMCAPSVTGAEGTLQYVPFV
jgi:Fe-S-cluster containining protein